MEGIYSSGNIRFEILLCIWKGEKFREDIELRDVMDYLMNSKWNVNFL